jgi:hypothetical protein
MLIAGCATTVHFPVSSELPAADLTAKIKTDDNNNYLVDLKAKHLASPERLNPSKDIYLVWLVTEDGEFQNLGMLSGDNSKQGSLKTVTSLKPERIIVTAEKEPNLREPGNHVIFESKRLSL